MKPFSNPPAAPKSGLPTERTDYTERLPPFP